MQDIGESKYRFVTASVVGQHGQPGAEPHHAQPRTSGRRGRRDGRPSPDGAMAGYVVDCTGTLRRSDVGAEHLVPGQRKLADAEYYGSILLGRANQNVVILGELSKYADPKPGQEVVTTGFFAVFSRRRTDRLGRERPRSTRPARLRQRYGCGSQPKCRAERSRAGRQPRLLRNPQPAAKRTNRTTHPERLNVPHTYHISDFSRRRRCFRFSCSTT